MYNATSRPCIYVRNHINILLLLEFCSRDVTTVRKLYSSQGNQRVLAISNRREVTDLTLERK
jgi:hypothetical protein